MASSVKRRGTSAARVVELDSAAWQFDFGSRGARTSAGPSNSQHLHEEYSSGQPVEYSKVCQAVLSTASKSKKALPHLYSFALKAAGGHSPWLLDETESFVRALASGTSILSADLWQALSMDVKGNSQHLRFRHAMVACQIVKYIVLFLFLDT